MNICQACFVLLLVQDRAGPKAVVIGESAGKVQVGKGFLTFTTLPYLHYFNGPS